jgi:replicative DNA helicase
MAGKGKDYFSAWFNAKKYTPENIINSSDQFLKMYNSADDHVYVPTGISDFDDLCMGLMQGHFTLFKAQTGIGKTEFMRYLEFNILKNHPDISIAAWHMEETKLRTLLGLVSYDMKKNVTRKDLIEEEQCEDAVRDSIHNLTKNERFYQFFLNDEDDPLDILGHIRYLSQACGVRYVFFEPIQDIAANMGGDESKEQFLADLSVRLSKLAAELGIGIVTIGHTNDDGAVKYCRMIEQRASVVVELQRDKMSEDIDERNTTQLLVTKNRPVGPTGYAGQLKFNPNSFTLEEKYGQY